MFTYIYRTKGTCSTSIEITLDDNIIQNIKFTGGCHGNLQAIPKLCEGLTVDEVSKRLSGIDCRGRGTSCGDQLSIAVIEAYEASKAQ
ncbi:MAG: TIGR03905 family TSCPD domain-containing protein [Lachnospiraceae bacterium]|nr:TIGR03905 family TSCPD domain-containing protein [Lachnospiraceae bacterium]